MSMRKRLGGEKIGTKIGLSKGKQSQTSFERQEDASALEILSKTNNL